MKYPSGRLTATQREKFSTWMQSKAPLIGKCPLCGERRWGLMEHFVELPIFRGGNIVAGGPSYPGLGLVCGNCGNTQVINAVVSGVYDSDESEPT